MLINIRKSDQLGPLSRTREEFGGANAHLEVAFLSQYLPPECLKRHLSLVLGLMKKAAFEGEQGVEVIVNLTPMFYNPCRVRCENLTQVCASMAE
jgi:hypothetical protein